MSAAPDPFCQILALSLEERRALMEFLQASAERAGAFARDEARYFETILMLGTGRHVHSIS